jgi:hypothetical protein
MTRVVVKDDVLAWGRQTIPREHLDVRFGGYKTFYGTAPNHTAA